MNDAARLQPFRRFGEGIRGPVNMLQHRAEGDEVEAVFGKLSIPNRGELNTSRLELFNCLIIEWF